MPIEDGIEMILKALSKRTEDKAWQLYLMRYQHMAKDDYIPFEEFYNPSEQQQHANNNKSADEILTDVKNILNMKGMKK